MNRSRPATTPSPHDIEAGTADLLRHAADLAIDYRSSLAERRVGPEPGITADRLRAALGGPLPERGEDPREVVDALVEAVEPGLVAMASPRYFGFVIGGSVPAALAVDWLTATWDQNSVLYLATPAASVTAWLGGTTFHGRVAMRISVSNWATDEADGDRSVEALARCLAAARGSRSRAG